MSASSGVSLTIPVERGMLRPTMQQQRAMDAFLQTREGLAVAVKFSRPFSTRSKSQNSYLWGVVYTLIAESTGHTTEEVHDACKEMFLPRKFITIGNHEVQAAKSTTELTTEEFEKYLQQVRAWADTELGIRTPLPNE